MCKNKDRQRGLIQALRFMEKAESESGMLVFLLIVRGVWEGRKGKRPAPRQGNFTSDGPGSGVTCCFAGGPGRTAERINNFHHTYPQPIRLWINNA